MVLHTYVYRVLHTEKYFLNHVNHNQIWIVITILWYIWHQTEFRLAANGNLNPNLVFIINIQKIFLCAYRVALTFPTQIVWNSHCYPRKFTHFQESILKTASEVENTHEKYIENLGNNLKTCVFFPFFLINAFFHTFLQN